MTAYTSERHTIDGAVAQLFTPDDARRVQALRALFVEQLDFARATGAIQVTPPPSSRKR